MARRRTNRDLYEAILFPSSSVVREFETYRVETKEGRLISGLIVSESEDSIKLQQQIGEPTVISRDEIEQIEPSPVSLMPAGLEQQLSDQELVDLVAYLRTLD